MAATLGLVPRAANPADRHKFRVLLIFGLGHVIQLNALCGNLAFQSTLRKVEHPLRTSQYRRSDKDVSRASARGYGLSQLSLNLSRMVDASCALADIKGISFSVCLG